MATEIFASNSIVNNLSEDGHNEEVSGNSEQGTLFVCCSLAYCSSATCVVV